MLSVGLSIDAGGLERHVLPKLIRLPELMVNVHKLGVLLLFDLAESCRWCAMRSAWLESFT